MSQKIGLHIGANYESIKEAKVAILDILKCGQDQTTIQKALETLADVTKVNYTNVSNNSFNVAE